MNIAVNVIITGLTPVGPVMKVLLHMKKLKPSHIIMDEINYDIYNVYSVICYSYLFLFWGV